MFILPNQRIVRVGAHQEYLGIRPIISNNLKLPERTVAEMLDYAVDISNLLIDNTDRIIKVQAVSENMTLNWLSFWRNYILIALSHGSPGKSGRVALDIITSMGRRFNLSLTQLVQNSPFDPLSSLDTQPPNQLAFPGTTSLIDPNGSVFIFG